MWYFLTLVGVLGAVGYKTSWILAVAVGAVFLFGYESGRRDRITLFSVIFDTSHPLFMSTAPAAYLDGVRLFEGLGCTPRASADTPKILRALLRGPVVVDCVLDPRLHADVWSPVAGYTKVCHDPVGEAYRVEFGLRQRGYEVRTVPNPDPMIPKGRMAVLLARGPFSSVLFVFRRHALLMGGVTPWNWRRIQEKVGPLKSEHRESVV